MTKIARHSENLDSTTEDFIRLPSGIETEILPGVPPTLPSTGFVKLYIKGTSLYYLDEDGNEILLSGGGGSAEEYGIKNFTAGETLGGHRVVRIANDGKVYYASKDESTHYWRVIGITSSAVDAGNLVSVRFAGIMTEPSWTWTVGTPVWLSTNGLLVQTVPTTGFVLEVGEPQTATTLLVGKRTQIKLA